MRTLLTVFLMLLMVYHYGQQTFQNTAPAMGITGMNGLGHAVGWGDIDNDGDPDLGISNQEGNGFWFFRNDGDHFTNITASAGLGGLGGNKIIITEVTGDEYNDLVLRTRSSTQYLFESNGDGTFNDITAASGIADAAVYNIADFNNDGLTDLLSVAGPDISILYNNGNSTFSDAEIIAPLPDFFGVAVLDYDRDGWMDIYWTTYGDNPNTLLKNNGDGSFSNVTSEAGVEYAEGAHALDVGDFDNDGFVDIYVGSYSNLNCKLFKNNGDGTFNDISVASGTTGHHDTRTTVFTDYNNDGYLDIFSSHHDFYSYSNTMLKNNGDETFTEVAPSLGISGEFIGDYFGQGWADYNLDGAMDFFAAGHIDKYRLFKNTNCPGSYLAIDLKGIVSNPGGIGAQVDVWHNGQRISRNLLPNGGFHDFSMLRLHFGLNGASSVDSISIYWPSGIVQKLGNTDAGQLISITEDTLTTHINTEIFVCPVPITVSPNPAQHSAKVSFYQADTQNVTISILDTEGRQIRVLYNGLLEKGGHEFKFTVDDLQNGLYLVKTNDNSQVQITKFIVQKR